jgi:FMN reductase (NADPH)/FMN reductase [NAD(P)H]
MNNTIEMIHKRRSIRSFKKKELSKEYKDTIVRAAMRSPTAGNMMLYSIIEVSDQNVKEQLVKSCDNQPFIARSPFVLLFLADYQRWMDYFEYCKVKTVIEREKIPDRTPQIGDLMLACCDTLIAAQTAVIAAESLGIGSCYIGDIMENYEFHKELFNLPKYTFPITMLCFGYPTEKSLKREYTTRLNQEYMHFNDKYRKLDKYELRDMYKDRELKNYVGSAHNFGQHMYLKKFTADFTVEMTRSVQEMIKEWCSKD